MKRTTLSAVSGTLACATLACKMLGSSSPPPEDVCARLVTIGVAKESDKAGCEARMSAMKSEKPDEYKCAAACAKDHDDDSAAKTCLNACTGSKSTKGASTTSKRTSKVDGLSPSDVKSALSRMYRNRGGTTVLKDGTNSAGWAGTIQLGRKSGHGELYVVSVGLLKTTSRADGYAVAKKFTQASTGAKAHQVGEKQVLVVQCMLKRERNHAGAPKKCKSFDSHMSYLAKGIVSP